MRACLIAIILLAFFIVVKKIEELKDILANVVSEIKSNFQIKNYLC